MTQLNGDAPEVLGVKAKILAISGKAEEALEAIEQLKGCERHCARAITLTILNRTEETIQACDTGLLEFPLPEKSRQLLFVLRARARFRQALKGWFDSQPEDAVLPMYGPAGVDLEQLQIAWKDVQAASASMRRSGWPPNVEFLADVWSASASILGKQHVVLPQVLEAAATRPTLTSLQAAAESLAVACGDFRSAHIANARQPETPELLLKRIALLHMSGQHRECVELLATKSEELPKTARMYGPVLAMGALSAEKLVRLDLSAKWHAELESSPSWAAEAALAAFERSISESPLQRKDALKEFLDAVARIKSSPFLAMNALHALDPSDREEAGALARIAEELQGEVLLPMDMIEKLAHALCTLERWDDVRSVSVQAAQRFGESPRLTAYEALALDHIGKTSDALARLEILVSSTDVDQLALNTYTNIALRCGFTERAVESVEKLLANEGRREKRLKYLRLLFGLLHQWRPEDQRCVAIAWRIGEEADPKEEEEEGLFLLTMTAATLFVELSQDDHRLLSFQERLRAFLDRFPNSRLLRAAQFKPDSSPEELLSILQELAGEDSERDGWRHRVERQLHFGQLSVPYSMRPRLILQSIPDTPSLWRISKSSRADQRELHLPMAVQEGTPISKGDLERKTPLLDLITLLVVKDLGLFASLFDAFPHIAIGQHTLLALARQASPMLSGFAREECLELQRALQSRIKQIRQPVVQFEDSQRHEEVLALRELRQLANSGEYILFSDDVVTRLYCSSEGEPNHMCTLDLLRILDERGAISPEIASEKIAQLCAWRVGVFITARYQLAALPSALGDVKSVAQGVSVLRKDPVAFSIFHGIWGNERPYAQLQTQAASLLRQLIDRHQNSVLAISSLLALWHEKVRLKRDAPSPIKCLALLIAQSAIASQLSQESARRLWAVYLQLVENEFGERMDEKVEKQAIEILGATIAEIESATPAKEGLSLYSSLECGLTSGTSAQAAFSEGYREAKIKAASKDSRKTPRA